MTHSSPEAAGPVGNRVLQGLILAMAGLVASSGVTFGCMTRNFLLAPGDYAHSLLGLGSAEGLPTSMPHRSQLAGSGPGDLAITVVCLVAMVIWGWAVVRFVRERPRAPLTYVLTVGIVILFAWSSWGVWRFAYPVCNPF